MLIEKLSASLVRNLLSGKGVKAKTPGQGILGVGEKAVGQARI